LFVSKPAADKQEWQRRAPSLHDVQCRHPVKADEATIGEHEVDVRILQSEKKFFASSCGVQCALEALAFESSLNQDHIVWFIL
jgi:hypothetical protein